MPSIRSIFTSFVGIVACSSVFAATAPDIQLEFQGELVFAKSAAWAKAPIGGLSGVDYDKSTDRYLFISDDGAIKGTARFYEGVIQATSSGYQASLIRKIELKNSRRLNFQPGSLDPESLRLNKSKKHLYWTSEGDREHGIKPFVRVADRQGYFVTELPLPDYYLPQPSQGIRHNQGFESLSFSTDGSMLHTVTEAALMQDGAADSLVQGSLCRWLVWDSKQLKPLAEYVYETDPVVAAPDDLSDFHTNGLVEILALEHDYFLALERSYTVGKGTDVRLYLTSPHGATNTLGKSSLKGLATELTPMTKKLILHLNQLPITMDNIEGMALGPKLKNGKRLLVLVADDNFSDKQKNQLLIFTYQLAKRDREKRQTSLISY